MVDKEVWKEKTNFSKSDPIAPLIIVAELIQLPLDMLLVSFCLGASEGLKDCTVVDKLVCKFQYRVGIGRYELQAGEDYLLISPTSWEYHSGDQSDIGRDLGCFWSDSVHTGAEKTLQAISK